MPDRPEQPTAAGNNKPLTKEQLDVLNEQLAYAAKFGEFKTIKSCLEQGADVNAGPYLNRTPLWSTVFYDRLGSHEIVQFLLERGADVESRDSDGETPLWRASAEGNEKNVQLLLNSKAQVNVRDNYGNPAVFQAIRNDRREIIPILIKAGADIDDKNEDGETSLWKAAKDGDEDKVSMLLEWGADVNATNHAGSSVLSAAAASSNDTIVRLLLDASTSFDKPDIELEDDNGLTALWRALENKATVCSALLIEEGANIRVRDKNSGSIVFIAAASGNESILRSLLLDDKEDIESKDEYGRTVLRHVLSSGDHKCIDLVLGLKPKIDLKVVEGSSTLHEATRAGSHTAINYLLDGKDPTARTDDLDGKGHTPLWLALSTRNQLCIDLLWQQDPDLKKDIKDGSLLHQAARFGNSKAIELLLREELHTESTDDYGRTPLWLAVNARDEPCVKILLGATEDIDTQDKNGVSILHQAVKKKELKIVKMLLNGPEDGKSSIPGASAETESESMVERATVSKFKHRKPSIDTKDNHGDWPLGQAFADHSYDIADALLLAGAAVETTNENGQTVLWQAVTRVDLVAVARLLNAKANVNAKSPSNVSVLHQAVIEDNVDLVRLLLGESTATVDATTELVHPDGKVKISPLVETTQPPSQIAAARISPDVNTTDTAGESPLLAAVNNKSMEIVKLLLKQKLKFDGVDPQGDSELAQAAYQGSAEMVEELLKAGADAKKANRDGWTPLHWAVRRSHAGVWDKLLDHNADIFAVNEYGKTPVHIAVDNGHVSFIELLESRSKAIKRQPIAQKGKARSTNFLDTQFADGETILHMAAAGRKLDVLNFLLASNVNISATTKKGETALHVAVEVVFFKGVKRLLSKMDAISIGLMNCNGDTALHLACRDDRKDMVKGILAKISTTGRDTAAKKNNTNETPLSISVENESLDVLLLLVNFEADVKYIEEDEHLLKLAKAEGQPNSKSAAKSDVQSLRWATMEDPLDDIDAQAAGELLDNEDIWKDELEDEDIKGEKRENRTKTLYWASRNGYKPLVEKILRAEEVDLGNALYWAAVGNKIKIVEFLFATYKHSPAIRSESVAGKAIQAAARNGHQTIVQYLIKNLIKTDGKTFSRGKAKDSYTDTWTPLHWAIDYQYKGNDDLDIVRNMLMNGADPEKMETGIGAESATSLVKSMCDIFSKKDYDTILGLLESPLRIPPKPISLVDPAVGHPAAAEFICKSFSANIVDFYTADGRFFTLERKKSIHDIIYDRDGGPDYLMDHAKTSWNLDDIVLEDRLRWIHLPANNWIWAEHLMTRIASESRKSAPEYTRLNKFVELNKREHPGKPQCQFMYPALTFESRNFHSGEGVNIPKLQAEAKRRKYLLGKKSEQPQGTKEPSDENLNLLKSDQNQVTIGNTGKEKVKGGGAGLEEEKAAKSKDAVAPGPEAPEAPQLRAGEIPKSTKKETDDKLRNSKKGTLSHLHGSRLALCMPYITSQSVGSHRALRQAIRLAEAVMTLKKKLEDDASERGSRNQILDAEPNEAQSMKSVSTKEEQLRQQARQWILQEEIAEGLMLLTDIDGNFYTDLNKLAGRRISNVMDGSDREKDWVSDLRALHKKMRRSRKLCAAYRVLEWLERFFDAIEIVQPQGEVADNTPMHDQLLEYYLNPVNSKGLHASRTLDQYYYAALEDTSRRDLDQVVRRFQQKKMMAAKPMNTSIINRMSPRDRFHIMRKEQEAEESKEDDNGWEDDADLQIIMVDQLWLWIIDDGTVITCFPGRWGPDNKHGTSRHDLVNTIRKHIHAERRPQISSVYHMATIIASLCACYIEDCKAGPKDAEDNLLDMFADSIGLAADEEVTLFETFKLGLVNKATETGQKTAKADEFDILREITLLEEIKDIRDELNILRSIFEDQRALLNKLLNLIVVPHPAAEGTKNDPVVHYYRERSDMDLRIEKAKKMDLDAGKTYDSINHLLDLRQKHANLEEAEKAAVEAKATVAQGRIMMVFTLVTIVFLPLSFLTSLYALNVDSFPHSGQDSSYVTDWIFPRIFGTSAAIGIPLIWIAIFINPLIDLYDRTIRAWCSALYAKWWTDLIKPWAMTPYTKWWVEELRAPIVMRYHAWRVKRMINRRNKLQRSIVVRQRQPILPVATRPPPVEVENDVFTSKS